jgi:hypothetical protein
MGGLFSSDPTQERPSCQAALTPNRQPAPFTASASATLTSAGQPGALPRTETQWRGGGVSWCCNSRDARASMNTILKTAVALTSMFILLGHAEAGSEEPPAESTTSTAPGVVDKVGNAVARGAKAAASGVERGVKAAAGGVERGAKAAASGIERGAKATARGVEHGAKATASAASRVAGKVGSSPASSPASSPTTEK